MEGNVLVIGDEQLLERLEDEIVEEMIEESESVRLPGYFIYALLGCLVAVIGLLVAVILLSYKRRRNSKVVKLQTEAFSGRGRRDHRSMMVRFSSWSRFIF